VYNKSRTNQGVLKMNIKEIEQFYDSIPNSMKDIEVGTPEGDKQWVEYGGEIGTFSKGKNKGKNKYIYSVLKIDKNKVLEEKFGISKRVLIDAVIAFSTSWVTDEPRTEKTMEEHVVYMLDHIWNCIDLYDNKDVSSYDGLWAKKDEIVNQVKDEHKQDVIEQIETSYQQCIDWLEKKKSEGWIIKKVEDYSFNDYFNKNKTAKELGVTRIV
jgi:hypothetical protein